MRNTEKQPSFWSGRTNKRFVLLFLLRFFFLLVELKILVAQLLDDCVEIHTLNGEKPPPAWRLAHAANQAVIEIVLVLTAHSSQTSSVFTLYSFRYSTYVMS